MSNPTTDSFFSPFLSNMTKNHSKEEEAERIAGHMMIEIEYDPDMAHRIGTILVNSAMASINELNDPQPVV